MSHWRASFKSAFCGNDMFELEPGGTRQIDVRLCDTSSVAGAVLIGNNYMEIADKNIFSGSVMDSDKNETFIMAGTYPDVNIKRA